MPTQALTPRHTCRLCGQPHRPVDLRAGETARCVRCGSTLAHGSRLGPNAGLAFSLTGVLLAVPAVLLPFVRAAKLGAGRTSVLFTGVASIWDQGMHGLAVLVLLAGWVLPILLLASLVALHGAAWLGRDPAQLPLTSQLARVLGHAAIPEVQVLAVLVALMKLGSLVAVTVCPGFWCYCAMAFCLLIAEHSFAFAPETAPHAAAPADQPTPA